MARNTSVLLGDHFAGFIDESIASGRYNSASDVIRLDYDCSKSMRPGWRPCAKP